MKSSEAAKTKQQKMLALIEKALNVFSEKAQKVQQAILEITLLQREYFDEETQEKLEMLQEYKLTLNVISQKAIDFLREKRNPITPGKTVLSKTEYKSLVALLTSMDFQVETVEHIKAHHLEAYTEEIKKKVEIEYYREEIIRYQQESNEMSDLVEVYMAVYNRLSCFDCNESNKLKDRLLDWITMFNRYSKILEKDISSLAVTDEEIVEKLKNPAVNERKPSQWMHLLKNHLQEANEIEEDYQQSKQRFPMSALKARFWHSSFVEPENSPMLQPD